MSRPHRQAVPQFNYHPTKSKPKPEPTQQTTFSPAVPSYHHPIHSSSRVRLVLGETGTDYLLIVNHPAASQLSTRRNYHVEDFPPQTLDWNNIPEAIARRLDKIAAREHYVVSVDWGRTGAWHVAAAPSLENHPKKTRSWWGKQTSEVASSMLERTIEEDNEGSEDLQVTFGTDGMNRETMIVVVPDACHSRGAVAPDLLHRIEEIYETGGTVTNVRLFHENSYFISDGTHVEWANVREDCSRELSARCSHAYGYRHTAPIQEIAIASATGAWILFHGNDGFTASHDISSELLCLLHQYGFQSQPSFANVLSPSTQNTFKSSPPPVLNIPTGCMGNLFSCSAPQLVCAEDSTTSHSTTTSSSSTDSAVALSPSVGSGYVRPRRQPQRY